MAGQSASMTCSEVKSKIKSVETNNHLKGSGGGSGAETNKHQGKTKRMQKTK